MKAIMLMFDTLNRHLLEPYGCAWTKTPNFTRLAEHGITFDRCYAGSLPCMPARRELHTGRYNFLHRGWGPLEPFDDSLPEILRKNGIYTHMISDHQHYWEDGGATYHQRYDSWEIVRGQEADKWKGQVKSPEVPEHLGRGWRQDWVNRQYIDSEEKQPLAEVFRLGLEFLETNKKEDNWFLHWECFDPHEPFFAAERYKELYPHNYDGPQFDWPEYGPVTETPEEVQHCRYEYAALLSMCDAYLGKFLDFMDENDMWKETLVIVNTDHGFLLGEHDLWAKSLHPWYNETAHIPMFICDPRSKKAGQRRDSLVQNIDIPVTILKYFGLEAAADMNGCDLAPVIENDKKVRDYALFGMHGAQVNITDGRYVYMRSPVTENRPLYNYTLMPTHMRCMFSPEEMKSAVMHKGFGFTKGMPVMKINAAEDGSGDISMKNTLVTALYDLEADPKQQNPIADEKIEHMMEKQMVKMMQENEAPPEQYIRLGFDWIN
ncbi:sulfatase [Clostridium sp. chh4-2]|uniref:sulfatase n=1 Tax=Clostridium sp. chh4-2 TaxID=2067550 RepID=UPI000CCDB29D|nr:sulfatase [Clostridium sp. chh4-2]PNV62478.1 sulfatase [Clostridium sp. chh4-2]